MKTGTSHKDVSVITRIEGCIPGNKTRNGACILHWAKEALETVPPGGNSRYAPRPLIVFQYVFTTCTTSYVTMARFTIVPVSHVDFYDVLCILTIFFKSRSINKISSRNRCTRYTRFILGKPSLGRKT